MTREEESALVRATLRIFGNWKVNDAQACRILGFEESGQLAGFRAGAIEGLSADILNRMALMLTIHTSLRTWFRDPARGYGWMRRPNQAFDNLTPIQLIETEAGARRLKGYLDASIQAG